MKITASTSFFFLECLILKTLGMDYTLFSIVKIVLLFKLEKENRRYIFEGAYKIRPS